MRTSNFTSETALMSNCEYIFSQKTQHSRPNTSKISQVIHNTLLGYSQCCHHLWIISYSLPPVLKWSLYKTPLFIVLRGTAEIKPCNLFLNTYLCTTCRCRSPQFSLSLSLPMAGLISRKRTPATFTPDHTATIRIKQILKNFTSEQMF